MAGRDSYSWIGGTTGTWGNPANWEDLTTATVAAVAPGIDNAVTISGTVAGTGSAASLTIIDGATVLGDINTGTLVAPGPVTLSVLDGGSLQAGGMSLGSTAASFINVDGNSAIEIGNAGSAAVGALTVDPGATLAGAFYLNANLIDEGVVASSNLTLTELGLGLSGTGTVEALAGGTIFLGESVAASGLTFQLDGGALLSIDDAPIPSASTIDLIGNANTIAITFGLPAVDATIYGFNTTDQLDVSGSDFGLVYQFESVAFADGALTLTGFHLNFPTTYTLDLAGDYSGDTFELVDGNVVAVPTVCFLAGTRIATDGGEREVERLAPGDMVMTLSGRVRRIIWIGTGQVLATRNRRSAATPVIVRKGALGDNVPHTDLRVTKAHSLYLEGVLVPAEFLVNHRTILWDDHAQEETIYHIELETHDVLLANGAPAESYRDDGNRWLFRNANSGWGLPPQKPWAPVLTGGPRVDAVWRALLDRAGPRRSPPLTDDPGLHLLVDDVRVDASERTADLHVFRLISTPVTIRITSRAGAPQELGLSRDPRSLGVALRRIIVRQGTRFKVAKADDARLIDGFHDFETDNGFRWTNGYAAVPDSLFADFRGPWELVLHLGGTTHYVADGAAKRAA